MQSSRVARTYTWGLPSLRHPLTIPRLFVPSATCVSSNPSVPGANSRYDLARGSSSPFAKALVALGPRRNGLGPRTFQRRAWPILAPLNLVGEPVASFAPRLRVGPGPSLEPADDPLVPCTGPQNLTEFPKAVPFSAGFSSTRLFVALQPRNEKS